MVSLSYVQYKWNLLAVFYIIKEDLWNHKGIVTLDCLYKGQSVRCSVFE